MEQQKPQGSERLVNYRPLVLFALCFGAGITLGKELKESGLWIFAALIGCFVLIAFVIRFKRAALALAALLTGILRITAAYPALPSPGEYQLSGKIYDVPLYEYGSWDILLTDAKVNGRAINTRVKLTLDDREGENEFAAGDMIIVKASVSLPKGATNEGALDMRHYLLGKGIGITAYASKIISKTSGEPDLHNLNLKVQSAVCANIEKLYPKNAELMKGILLGFDNEMDEEMLGDFRDTGLSHILSVSGLHVGFFVAVLSVILTGVNARVRFLVIGMFLLFYCAITAFPESLVRASVMTLLMLAAGVIGRRNDPPTSLAIAFILILIVNPFQLFAAGFQLSFGAVAGMLMLYKPFCCLFRGLFAPLCDSLAVSASATLGTLPLTLWTFNRLALYGIIANIFAVPVSSLALIPAFLAVIICFVIPALAVPIAAFSDFMLELMLFIVQIISSVPYGVVKIASPSAVLCFGFVVLMLLLSPYVLIKSRLKKTGAVLLVLFCVIMAVVPVLLQPECTIAILDAKGCSPIHMRFFDQNYILDMGGLQGAYMLSRLLSHRGVTVIDGAAVTSLSDAKAVAQLSEQIKIRTAYVFEDSEDIRLLLEAKAVTVQTVSQNEPLLVHEGLTFSYNDGLIVQYNDFFLCTKNAPGNAVVRVINSNQVQFEAPSVAVFAGGSSRSADFWMQDTKAFSTSEQGEILIEFRNGKIRVSTAA